jgi:hypothetical protein
MRQLLCSRIASLFLAALSMGVLVNESAAATFARGDVFVGLNDGTIHWIKPNNTPVATLSSGSTVCCPTGMAFDKTGNLCVATYAQGKVIRFDNTGAALTDLVTGGIANDESIILDCDGYAYVGHKTATPTQHYNVLKYDPSGTQVATYLTQAQMDWMALAPDQKTLYFTSEDPHVHRYDLSTSSALPDFVNNVFWDGYCICLRTDGTVLVSDEFKCFLFASNGAVLKTYAPGSTNESAIYFAMALDPDGRSFWVGSHDNTRSGLPDVLYRVDIATGDMISGYEFPTFIEGVGVYSGGGISCSPMCMQVTPEDCSADCLGAVNVDQKDWLHDAFPFNADSSLPGTALFDTTSALIATGRNTAQLSGDPQRPDIPGDSLVACACGEGMRLDMVFRIVPGPGNYVVHGNKISGLRRVPTAATQVVSGDVSFWGQYLANNGAFGTPGGHSGGQWDPNVWNSARMDSAEINLFPVRAMGNLPQLEACRWSGTYHESDPKYATLGIVKNRCFLIDTTGAVAANPSNITCNSVPAWVTTLPPSRTGYDGSSQTREYTKIIPDGLLTPGSHVEYFLRLSPVSAPGCFKLTPDTNRVTPQYGERTGGASCGSDTALATTDGHRWQEFSVLPDKWKDPQYGGDGYACMLYVDLDDGFGDERAWVVAADMMGATKPSKYGAHNGWHVSKPDDDPNDHANFVARHGGQAGTTWDMFGVRGVDDPVNGFAGSLGSRLATLPTGLAAGKQARIGPTEQMLWTYYRILYMTTGRFDQKILGPMVDRSQDDVQMLTAFRARSIGGLPRGCFVEGANFAESEDVPHPTLLGTLFGASLLNASYPALTSNVAPCVGVATTPLTSPIGNKFGVFNSLIQPNDVLKLSTLVSTATVANTFAAPGGTFVTSSTAVLPFSTTYWTGLLDSWQIQDLDGPLCPGTGVGRTVYLQGIFQNVFDALCPVYGMPSLGISPTAAAQLEPVRVLSNPSQRGHARLAIQVSRPGDPGHCGPPDQDAGERVLRRRLA